MPEAEDKNTIASIGQKKLLSSPSSQACTEEEERKTASLGGRTAAAFSSSSLPMPRSALHQASFMSPLSQLVDRSNQAAHVNDAFASSVFSRINRSAPGVFPGVSDDLIRRTVAQNMETNSILSAIGLRERLFGATHRAHQTRPFLRALQATTMADGMARAEASVAAAAMAAASPSSLLQQQAMRLPVPVLGHGVLPISSLQQGAAASGMGASSHGHALEQAAKLSDAKPPDNSTTTEEKPNADGCQAVDSSSNDEQNEEKTDASGRQEPFPEKLHRLLMEVESQGKSEVISFTADGMAFKIHKPEVFFRDVIPKYFNQSRLSSFKRQLNLYGFEIVTSGPDKGAYYNEFFVRDKPGLCRNIRRGDVRLKSKPTSRLSSRPSAPDFYSMPPITSSEDAKAIAYARSHTGRHQGVAWMLS